MTRLACLSIATALAVTGAGISANASESSPPAGSEPVVVDTLPRDTLAAAHTIPDSLLTLGTLLNEKYPSLALRWDDKAQQLIVYVDPDTDASGILSAARAAAGTGNVVVEHADYAAKRLEAAAKSIAEAGTLDGVAVAWAAPQPDRSGIDVGLVEAPQKRSATDSDSFEGIPVATEVTGPPEAASRDWDAGPAYIAGADMNRDSATAGYIAICTTSFAVRSALNVKSLLTADHCARGGGGNTWRTTNQYSNTPAIGSHPLVLPAPGFNPDAVLISGQDYGPYMYYGPNTANTAASVQGTYSPIVGGYVHYSGARSGSVYNNLITHTGLTVNYDPGLTYSGLARTVQNSGIPAVGNGDSGGPVFALNANGQVLATGIISGMEAPTTTCNGDPGINGRQCDDVAFFAPVVPYLAGIGYSILTP
jgi:hypothetical protein